MRSPHALALVLVALGGAAGTAVRVVVSYTFPEQALAQTLAVNVAGAFALGLLLELLSASQSGEAGEVRESGRGGECRQGGDGRQQQEQRRQRRRDLQLLLGTGFCGGFTTYSLIAFQAAQLTRDGDVNTAVIYGVLTLVLGAAAAMGGVLLAGLVRGTRRQAHS